MIILGIKGLKLLYETRIIGSLKIPQFWNRRRSEVKNVTWELNNNKETGVQMIDKHLFDNDHVTKVCNLKGLGHANVGNFSTDQMVIELTKIWK